jgi:hypothetical protein
MKNLNIAKWDLKKYDWGKLGLELLVVFLGISSGFILNNWREESKQLELEQKYISGFIADVEDSIDELREMNKKDSLWLVAANRNISGLKARTLSKDSADALITRIIQINKIEIKKGTYEDIINSGNLNLIRNFDLKGEIVDYGLAVEGVAFVDDYFYQFFNEYVMTFVFKEFDIINGKIIDEEIYKTISFSNIFGGYYSMVLQRNVAYKDLLLKSIEFRKNLLKEKEKFD